MVLTLSGAMTIAKMGKVISKMIDAGMVQAIVSTGALMAHGLSEAVGLVHYRHDPRMSDEELFEKGYNRVYDTLEMEANLNYVEEFTLARAGRAAASRSCRARSSAARWARCWPRTRTGSGVLRSAYEKGVPVYVPAFTDSELGLDLSTWAMKRAQAAGDDRRRRRSSTRSRATTPTSTSTASRASPWARSGSASSPSAAACRATGRRRSGPYIDIMNHRLGLDLTPPRYQYAVRICPEPTHWGGLSGCTYSEGVSWGKFVPEAEGGRFAEVYADATTVWPLLIKGVLEERAKGGHARPAPKNATSHGRLEEPHGPQSARHGKSASRAASGKPRKVKAKPRP